VALHGRRALGVPLAILWLILLAGAPARAVAAEFEIVPGSFMARMLDAEGHPENRAGSHPDRLQVDFALNVVGTAVRDFVFEMPPGFGGNPDAVPLCSRTKFEEGEECPPESQVGVFQLGFSNGGEAELPVFQLEPAPGRLFAFASKPGFDFPFTMGVRPGDFGITLEALDLAEPPSPISEGHMELWGVPADHQTGAPIPRRPFLTAPARCGPLIFTFRARSWEEGAAWLSADADTGAPLTDCEDLRFEPTLGLHLDNPIADSPTGLRIDLTVPEDGGADERGSAQIRDATIELPAGLAVSPAGAQQLTACSDAQFAPATTAEPLCPPSSKVGAAEVESRVFPETLPGAVYLGAPHPGEPFRLLVFVPGPGFAIKFASALRVDQSTGRLLTTLEDLPPVSFQRLSLEIDGGADALLASPLSCGSATATGRFEPSGGGSPVAANVDVGIKPRQPGSPCPGPLPFAPQLAVQSSNLQAGRPSTFSATVRRQPGEELSRRFSVEMPAGLSPSLGSIPPCGDASASAGACPATSQIGSALAEIGSGPAPATLRGGVYVTGPYRRAPFGLLVEFQATIGPFDFGTLAVRAAANVNGRSGRITVLTDRLPETVEGVPVRFQSIELSLDRQGLIRNPTRCVPGAVDATVEAQSGASATVVSPFRVHGCRRLGFKPRFHLAFDREDRLRVSATLRAGDARLRALKVSLPKELKLDLDGLGEICSAQDATDGACPSGSRVGSATARTPLLSQPLRGSIYIAQPNDAGLPDLWLDLAAAGVRVEVRGETSSQDGHMVTSLAGLPDMPFSYFAMRLGEDGRQLFSPSGGRCPHGVPRRLSSTVSARGQNGIRRLSQLVIEPGGGCG